MESASLILPSVVVSENHINNSSWTVVLLINTMLAVFKEAGVLGATILLLVFSYVAWYSATVVIEIAAVISTEDQVFDTYSKIIGHVLGPWGSCILNASIIVSLIGAMLSYMVVIGYESSSMIVDADSDTNDLFFIILFVVTICVVLPPCLLFRRYHSFTLLSAFSVAAIVCIVSFVLATSWYEREETYIGDARDYDSDYKETVRWIDAGGMIRNTGTTFFAMGFTYAANHAYNGLKFETPGRSYGTYKPNQERSLYDLDNLRQWRKVSGVAVGICAGLLFACGLPGYLAFRDATSGELLDNWESTYSYPFKTLLVIHLVLYIPPEVAIWRVCWDWFFTKKRARDETVMDFAYVGTTCGYVFGTMSLAMIFYANGWSEGDAFKIILNVAGAGMQLPSL
eukprot:gene6747-8070_t